VDTALRDGWEDATPKAQHAVQKHYDCCGFSASVGPYDECPAASDGPCEPHLKDAWQHAVKVVKIVALSVAGLQVVALSFSIILVCGIRERSARGSDIERGYLLSSQGGAYQPPPPSQLYPSLRADVNRR
jgi:hypothetical protein